MNQHLSPFFSTLVAIATGLLLLSRPLAAQAGCGCDKPPPAPAAVRPNATYGGMPVTLFSSSLQTGVSYNVTFTSMNGQSVTTTIQPTSRRDQSDGVYKKQLVVTVPNTLAIGPASITVKQAGQAGALLAIPDTSFTVVPQPITVPPQVGTFSYDNFQAAVGRNGVVYLSLDVSHITQPRTFRAQAKGLPLRFTASNVVIYNTQGFLMQLLNQGIPGLASITPSSLTDSDVLHYSRHEFNTYFLQHVEHLPHATDPTDGNWHQDGSRHVDHDHLILAISGNINGAIPTPGATAAFSLSLRSATLFDYGLVGLTTVDLQNDALTTSFKSSTWDFSSAAAGQGDVRSNGVVSMNQSTIVDGKATAAGFNLLGSWWIKQKVTTATVASFLPVSIPKGLVHLGAVTLTDGLAHTLSPGSYQTSSITIANGSGVVIDNRYGPVTLYVTGPIQISGAGSVTTTDPDPEKFAIYVANNSNVTLSGSGQYYGLLYAPQSLVTVSGWSEVYGAIVGGAMKMSEISTVYYDLTLRGQ